MIYIPQKISKGNFLDLLNASVAHCPSQTQQGAGSYTPFSKFLSANLSALTSEDQNTCACKARDKHKENKVLANNGVPQCQGAPTL